MDSCNVLTQDLFRELWTAAGPSTSGRQRQRISAVQFALFSCDADEPNIPDIPPVSRKNLIFLYNLLTASLPLLLLARPLISLFNVCRGHTIHRGREEEDYAR